ncbi:MAG: 4Fe-4S binding protein [Lachnospiraceae bacterium]|nr:4Fe-4S binding protein [Lachnospiraceae bacterium]
MEETGFQVIGAGAFVAKHSIVTEVAEGRPDMDDIAEIHTFATALLQKEEENEVHSLQVPGNEPYRTQMNMPVAPITLEGCKKCGKCEKICPAEAIHLFIVKKFNNNLLENSDNILEMPYKNCCCYYILT